MTLSSIRKELYKYKTGKSQSEYQRFFKSEPGEYGEGDLFLGLRLPDIRVVAKNNILATEKEINPLLRSKWHEERILALIIMNLKYKKADQKTKKLLFKIAQKNITHINNWDLVDLTAPHLFGPFVFEFDNFELLQKYSKSKNMWKRRIAMVSTFSYLRNSSTKETYEMALQLLEDKEDLIHKAVGWLLREAGKRNLDELTRFIKKHGKRMPRTTLRYAIEKYPEKQRQKILKETRN